MLNKIKTFNRAQILIFFTYYCSIVALIFLTIKFIIPFFMPFCVGFIVAFLLKPLTCAISNRTKLSRKICGALVVIIAYVIATFSIWFVFAKIALVVQTFTLTNKDLFMCKIMPAVKQLSFHLNNIFEKIAPNIGIQTDKLFEAVGKSIDKTLAETSKAIVIWIAKIGATIPNFLIGLTFAITSSIYISADYDNIVNSIEKLTPKKLSKLVATTKGYTIATISKYIKAFFLLLLLSFSTYVLGFFLIRIENPIGIAALTALCESVPILGSGIIVLPWFVTLIILQNFSLAFKIALIFVIASTVRGFLEPKILSKQMGLHPILTLISIYTGMKLFGFLGLILMPIAAQIGFSIYKTYGIAIKHSL